MKAPADKRRHELDWLRILAVLLLIYFHSARPFDFGDFYVKNGQLFACPSGPSPWQHMLVGGEWLCYGYNCYYFSGQSQARIQDVVGTIMIADSNGDNRIGPDYAVHEARCPGSSNCLIAPHNETLNIGFGDGHAKATRLATIDADDSVWFNPSIF